MIMKCTVPDPAEARALMTGIGQCEDDIVANGCARAARVARQTPPEKRKFAPPSLTQVCKDADDQDRYRATLNTAYQSGTLTTGIG